MRGSPHLLEFFFLSLSSNPFRQNPGQKITQKKAHDSLLGLREGTAVSFTSSIRRRDYKGGRFLRHTRERARVARVRRWCATPHHPKFSFNSTLSTSSSSFHPSSLHPSHPHDRPHAQTGALPRGRNNPMRCPFNLYAEQLSGREGATTVGGETQRDTTAFAPYSETYACVTFMTRMTRTTHRAHSSPTPQFSHFTKTASQN